MLFRSSTHELGSAWHQCRRRVDAVGIEPTTDTRHQLNRLITLMGCRLNGVGNALPTMLRIHPVLKRTGNLDGESNYRPKARAALTPHLKPLARGPLFPAADGQTKGSRFLVGFASCNVWEFRPLFGLPFPHVSIYQTTALHSILRYGFFVPSSHVAEPEGSDLPPKRFDFSVGFDDSTLVPL